MTTAAELRKQTILAWPEKKLQQEVIDLARALGWQLIYHTHDSRRSAPGFPDLVLIHPGRRRLIWRELKSEKGTLSPDQRTWLQGLDITNQDHGVWRPRDWWTETIHEELRA